MDKKLITKGLLTLFLFALVIRGNCVSFDGQIGRSDLADSYTVEQSNSSPLRGYEGNYDLSYNIFGSQDSQQDDPSQVMERPTVGSGRMLAIPVDFSDQEHVTSTSSNTTRWNNLENSVRTYYLENSFDKLALTVDVTPWLQAPLPISYYAHDDYMVSREMELANWLLSYWDQYILYSNYNYIFVVYAGSDAQDNSHFWPKL